jgi:hypothetical protein
MLTQIPFLPLDFLPVSVFRMVFRETFVRAFFLSDLYDVLKNNLIIIRN